MSNCFGLGTVLNRLLIYVTFTFSPVLIAEELSTYSKFPNGSKTEVIPFPMEFASDITLNGIEELVFLSGMYNPEKENFFSYAFSWTHQPEKNQIFSRSEIKKFIAAYYSGLYKVVSGDNEIDLAVTVDQVGEKCTGQIV
ncbi:hypothetical protein ACCI51_18060 [Microbulbifer echini]|uniref:Uncharacterized protein n=1 Tax=Microbulbifer echini TaxID=1529067 RepID=A0ABV4NSD2_9GAMM